jgi:hypothetical protein
MRRNVRRLNREIGHHAAVLSSTAVIPLTVPSSYQVRLVFRRMTFKDLLSVFLSVFICLFVYLLTLVLNLVFSPSNTYNWFFVSKSHFTLCGSSNVI